MRADDLAAVGALSPAQILARLRVLYPRLRRWDACRGRLSVIDEALIAEIRALSDRYRVLTDPQRAVA